jgi:hypothetical protein
VIIRILHLDYMPMIFCFFADIIQNIDNYNNFILIFWKKYQERYKNYIIIKIIILSVLIKKNKSTLEQMSEKSDYKIVIFKIN